MKKFAVIVAAGSGKRMGTIIPKQFLLLNNKPLLWYTITTFLNTYNDISIILVLPPTHMEEGNILTHFLQKERNIQNIQIVQGGNTRFHSVQNGLRYVEPNSIVFVHDGVRCLVTSQLIQACYKQTLEKGNAIPVIPSTDSIRILTTDENSHTIDRTKVMIVQTPQTFHSNIILSAFEQPYNNDFTDEASVVAASGTKIFLVEGAPNNIKITRPMDVWIAEKTLTNLNTNQSY